MREFLSWMQQSAVGHFMRESSLWAYPIVNLFHIFGIASLFGSILIIDLRLVGVWRRVPLAPLTDAAVPIARLGFAIAGTTGIGLLATKATEYYGNPFLLIKISRHRAGSPQRARTASLSGVARVPPSRAVGQREPSTRDHGRDFVGLLDDRGDSGPIDRVLVKSSQLRIQ